MKISRKVLDSMTILGFGVTLFGVGFNLRTSTKFFAYVLYALAAMYGISAIIQCLPKE